MQFGRRAQASDAARRNRNRIYPPSATLIAELGRSSERQGHAFAQRIQRLSVFTSMGMQLRRPANTQSWFLRMSAI